MSNPPNEIHALAERLWRLAGNIRESSRLDDWNDKLEEFVRGANLELAAVLGDRGAPGSAHDQWHGFQQDIAFEAFRLDLLTQWNQIRAAFETAHPEYRRPDVPASAFEGKGALNITGGIPSEEAQRRIREGNE